MKPETRTVTQLFELDVRYVVPLYQRPYVWDEVQQWAPLWDDIVTLVEHQEHGDGHHYSHFLGAVVLDQTTPVPGRIPVFTVIDGQQRLTTLQIIIAAAASVADEHGAANDAALLRELVRNNERKAAGIELYKVWPTNANRSAFQAVMSADGPPADRVDDPDNRIDEAHAYFREQINEWLDEVDEDAKAQRLELLRISFCDLLKVVSITLESEDNAQVIFETLNARGTPLLALDLVKNAVFLEAARQALNTDELYDELWRPQLDDDYWREPRRQGRLFRPVGELFLMHWLTMKLRRVVPATELFTVFRGSVLNATPPPPMVELIRELCRDAGIMRRFDSQPTGSVEAKFFRRLGTLDTSTVLPLVLLLFREAAISVERRSRALRMIESWLVRRMLMGFTTKNYNQQIPVIIGRVAADPERADEIIYDELRAGTTDVSRWPEDDELREHLAQQRMYGWIAQGRIAMVLAAIEESLYTSKVEALQVPSKLSIEHILPQSWQAHWPLIPLADEDAAAAEARRNAHLHLIGNLTLTTLPLNTDLSNSAWDVKQTKLNRGSKLLLNTQLIEAHGERFDEAAIEARGAELAARIIAIWPGPSSPEWGGGQSAEAHAPAADVETVPTLIAAPRAEANLFAEAEAIDAPVEEHVPQSADEVPTGSDAQDVEDLRDAVRQHLEDGLTPDQIYHRELFGRRRLVWLIAIEEEARLAGNLGQTQPTPANVVDLRERENLRWERIAARVYGNPAITEKVKRLYDEARGPGAAKRSYTGPGRRFPEET
jgi:Protein of unknown function DUF262/Protein of unknown function (DUF1524)